MTVRDRRISRWVTGVAALLLVAAACVPNPPDGGGTTTTTTATATTSTSTTSTTTSTSTTSTTTTTVVVGSGPIDVNDDQTQTDEGVPALIDVLANDSGAIVTSTLSVTGPAGHGTAEIAGTRIRYTPTPGYVGADLFGYQACDVTSTCQAATVRVVMNMFGPYRLVTSAWDLSAHPGQLQYQLPDGSGLHQDIVGDAGFITQISPDGAWLAYSLGNAGSGAPAVAFRSLVDGTFTSVAVPSNVTSLSWAPGSGSLAVGTQTNNYVYKIDRPGIITPTAVQLTYQVSDPNAGSVPVPVQGQHVSWGPGGIAFDNWLEWTSSSTAVQHVGIATVVPFDQPHEMVENAGLWDPSWSPDGTRLAVECSSGLCIYNPTNGGIGTLVASSSPATERYMLPKWSPDGTKIAFNDLLNGSTNAALARTDGTATSSNVIPLNQVPGGPNGNNYPAWFPSWDPRPYTPPTEPWTRPGHIVYTTSAPTSPTVPDQVVSSFADGSGRTAFSWNAAAAQRGLVADSAPSPDGTRIALRVYDPTQSTYQLVVTDRDGTHPATLADVGTPGGQLAWARDGSEISFQMQTAAHPLGLYAIHPDGTSLRQIASVYPSALYQTYSPDDRYLVFKEGTTIMYVPADGSTAPAPLQGISGAPDQPALSGDNHIVFGNASLVVGDITWDPTPTVSNRHTIYPSTAQNPSWSPDNSALVFRTSKNSTTPRVWVINADGTRPVQINPDTNTTINDTGAVHWTN